MECSLAFLLINKCLGLQMRSLTEKELSGLAKVIRDEIFVPLYEKKVTVFLCGADLKNRNSGRYKLANLLSEYKRYELIYPEDLFDDLLAGQGKFNLLTMENILAYSVDAIVILPESPGSFAELGAFANNELLARKTICIAESKYKAKKSFINQGPIKLIQKSKSGKVYFFDYKDFEDDEVKQKRYRSLDEGVRDIRKENPAERKVTNILEVENFILPCIYLMDNIKTGELIGLVQAATEKEKVLSEIAVRSSLSKLIKKALIGRTTEGYGVTDKGITYIRSEFKKKYIDRARVEVMNAQLRGNGRLSYDNIKNAHL